MHAGRVFCSHYQMLLCDDPQRYIPDEVGWNEAASQRGFAGDTRSRMVGTEADLNDHWIEVVQAEREPDLAQWERVTLVHFQSQTGWFHVMSVVDNVPTISVPIGVGDFSVYVAVQNLGVDRLSLNESDRLSDAQMAVRKDLEWYCISIVPGAPKNEGRAKDSG